MVETLTTEEWIILKETHGVLWSFDIMTTEISSKNMQQCHSKVTVLVHGLKSGCHKVAGTATMRGVTEYRSCVRRNEHMVRELRNKTNIRLFNTCGSYIQEIVIQFRCCICQFLRTFPKLLTLQLIFQGLQRLKIYVLKSMIFQDF